MSTIRTTAVCLALGSLLAPAAVRVPALGQLPVARGDLALAALAATLLDAKRWLIRVRTELHFAAGKAEDVLTLLSAVLHRP